MKTLAALTGLTIGAVIGWFFWPIAGPPNRDGRTKEYSQELAKASGTESIQARIDAIASALADDAYDYESSRRAWSIIESMSLNEIVEAVKALSQMKGRNPSQRSAFGRLLERWAMLDPEGYLDHCELDNAGTEGPSNNVMAIAFTYLMQQNPDAAIERLRELKSPNLRDSAQRAIADHLAASDPERLFAFAQHTAFFRSEYEEVAIRELARKDPDRAAELYLNSSRLRGNNFGALLKTWSESDPNAALAWLENHKDSAKVSYSLGIQTLAELLAPKDPLRALELIDRLPKGDQSAYGYMNVAQALLNTDPEAGLSVLDALAPGKQRNSALSSFGAAWASKDASAAVTWALTLTNPAEQANVFKSIANSLGNYDPKLTMKIIDAIPGGAQRDNAFNHYVKGYRSGDPLAMVSLAESLENPRQKHVVMKEAVRRWSESDAPKAVRFITESANPAQRPDLTRTWAQNLDFSGPPKAQLEQLQAAVSGLDDHEKRPFIDAFMTVQGEKLPPAVKAGLESGRPLEQVIDDTAPE
ncbi:MAG: hypothetical protein KDN22_26705 [Verrucomicrobiae bacterium]|nr:hypothetical protein [Verrucomicrobiae bacterium]